MYGSPGKFEILRKMNMASNLCNRECCHLAPHWKALMILQFRFSFFGAFSVNRFNFPKSNRNKRKKYIFLCHPHFQSIFPCSMLSHMRAPLIDYECVCTYNPRSVKKFFLCTSRRTESGQFLVEVLQSEKPIEFCFLCSQLNENHWWFTLQLKLKKKKILFTYKTTTVSLQRTFSQVNNLSLVFKHFVIQLVREANNQTKEKTCKC